LLATRRATGVGRRVQFETVFAARRGAVDERTVGFVALARTTVVADLAARLAVRTQVFWARCRAAVDHFLRVAAHRTALAFGRVQVRGVIALWARAQHGAAVWFWWLHRRFARAAVVADLTTRLAVRADVFRARLTHTIVGFRAAHRAALAFWRVDVRVGRALWQRTAHGGALVVIRVVARAAVVANLTARFAVRAQVLRAKSCGAVDFLLARWAAVSWFGHSRVAFFAQWSSAANVGARVGLALALPLWARGGEALFRRVDAFLAWFALDVTLANAVVVADVFATVAHTRGVAAVRVAHFGAVAFVRARTIGRRLHCWARQVGTRLYTVVFARTSCTAVEIRVTAFL